jgi:hypothetical protein
MAFQPFLYSSLPSLPPFPSGNNALHQLPSYGDRIFIEYDTICQMFLGNSDAQTFAANITSEIESYAQKKYAGVKKPNFQRWRFGGSEA